MDHRAIENRAAGERTPIQSPRKHAAHGVDARLCPVVLRDEVELFPIESDYGAEGRIAQLDGSANDRVEDRLDVRGRAADHAEDLARGGLLFVCLRKLAVPRLQEFRRGFLLLPGLAQRLPEAFDFGLQVIRVGPRDRARPPERPGAFLAELRLWAVLVLAGGTLHAGASLAGARSG